MTCQELVELVTDYFDGALDDTQRAEFDAHVNVCSRCEHYVQQMRVTLRSIHAVKALEQLPEVATLLDAFRDWHSRRGLGRLS
jgi:anti-sigma factor RsiW